jgi:hypothetical protein
MFTLRRGSVAGKVSGAVRLPANLVVSTLPSLQALRLHQSCVADFSGRITARHDGGRRGLKPATIQTANARRPSPTAHAPRAHRPESTRGRPKYLHGNLETVATNCRTPPTPDQSPVFASDLENWPPHEAWRGHPRRAARAPMARARRCRVRLLLLGPAVQMGMAVLVKYSRPQARAFHAVGRRHETAIVHPTATLGASVVPGGPP